MTENIRYIHCKNCYDLGYLEAKEDVKLLIPTKEQVEAYEKLERENKELKELLADSKYAIKVYCDDFNLLKKQNSKLADQLIMCFESIIRNDKTPIYTYHGFDAKNNEKERPNKGERYLTPKEMAEVWIKKLRGDDK